jgi:hypothetical protein
MDDQMKIGIRPLCDKHLTEMEAVRVQANMGGSDVWRWPAFRCNAANCTRLFESRGYLTISDGMADPIGRNCIRCDADGEMMFIEKVEDDRLLWRCSKETCQQSRITPPTLA